MKLRMGRLKPRRGAIASSTFNFCGSGIDGFCRHLAKLDALGKQICEVVQLSLRGNEIELLIADDGSQSARVTKVNDGHQLFPPLSPVR